jgi:hypothetical protein
MLVQRALDQGPLGLLEVHVGGLLGSKTVTHHVFRQSKA